MNKAKRLAGQTTRMVLAIMLIATMCLVIAPVPQKALAGEAIPELIAPGHTTQLNEGQYYVVTAELENWTGERLVNLYARLYAKQAESPDVDSPQTGLNNNELCFDPAPVAPGTQDGGQDFDADGDGWIENGSPSGNPFLPAGWMNDRGLTSAGPDDGNNTWSDDEGSGDNAWPWINTWELGGDRWMEIKDWVDSGSFTPDCPGVYDASTKYTSDFASFNHIRMKGDEPTVKQLDPLMPGQQMTVGWGIQCIGDGDVDIRVYFWEEGVQGEDHPDTLEPYVIGQNCAGLMWAGNEEMDSPCHDSLPDPADRDDWVNMNPLFVGDGNQTNEDWIWFTESQIICPGVPEYPSVRVEFLNPEICTPVGQDFQIHAVVTNNTPCPFGQGGIAWAWDVVAAIDPESLGSKVAAAIDGGTISYVGDLAPGASATVTFDLTSLQQGFEIVEVAAKAINHDPCIPQEGWCYADNDHIYIFNSGSPVTVSLTTSSGTGGSVIDPGEGSFQFCNAGQSGTITAQPDPCYQFVAWTGNGTPAITNPGSPNTTIIMDGNYSITANFFLKQASLTTSSTMGGWVSNPGEGTYQYDCGEVVSITAVGTIGYEFIGWTGNGTPAIANPGSPNTTITMSDDYSIVANFVELVTLPGPVSYWALNEGTGTLAYDSTGGNDGTINGADWVTGVSAGALDFNGTTDYIGLPNNSSLRPGSITLSAWVYPGTLGGQHPIVALETTTGLNQGAKLDLDDGLFRLYIGTGGDEVQFLSGTVTQASKWHHVVGTYDGTEAILWINGQNIDSEPLTGDISYTPTRDMRIGSWNAGTAKYFNGRIDEVRVYDRALGQQEILDLYNQDVLKNLNVAVDPVDSGTVTLNPLEGTYQQGTVVTLTGSPNTGYVFDHWSGSPSVPAVNPGTITINSDTWITAHFVPVAVPDVKFTTIEYDEFEGTIASIDAILSGTSANTITVQYSTNDIGSAVAGEDYIATSGTLTFVPGDTSEAFSVTINNDTKAEGPEQFNVILSNPINANAGTPSLAIVDIFDLDTRQLTVSSGTGGTVLIPGEGKFYYQPGSVVAILAIATAPYEFTYWTSTGGGVPSYIANPDSPNTFITMPGLPIGIVANFAIPGLGVTAELLAPGHTTHLDKGQLYVVTAEIENNSTTILSNLYARVYAKQSISDDSDTPGALAIDLVPVAPGTQDGGQDFDADGDGWIENGSPSISVLPLPPGWPNDRGLSSAGPDNGTMDDEGTGDNAWPWIDTGILDNGRWMDIKTWVNSGSFTNDCGSPLGGTAGYANDFCSFNHIRTVGDQPHVKQLDPLSVGEEQTIGWLIQCIGDGDVDVRVYFWEETLEGLTGTPTQELDNACHDNLPDPADRDDWVNGEAPGDYIWFTESQTIEQGTAQYTLTMTKSGSGSVTPAIGEHLYSAGSVIDLTAIPDPFYKFNGWTKDSWAITNPGSAVTTITMNNDYSIQANFVNVGQMVDIHVNLQGDNRPPEGWQVPLTVGFYPANSGTLVMGGSATADYYFTGTSSGIGTESGTRAMLAVGPVMPGTYDITTDSTTTLMNVNRGVNIAAPKFWGTAESISITNGGTYVYPQIAVNSSGNTIAVWSQYDETRYDIWSNGYVPGIGWGTAELIETDNAGQAYDPQVAVDGSGNAVAVWSQSNSVWSNRYVAGTGWGTAELVETKSGFASSPQVAVDGGGNAVVVWQQSNNVWSNRYLAGTGWDTAELIESGTGKASSLNLQVAVDGGGNAVTVWRQYDGTRDSIYSNCYVAGTGWGTAELIETGTGTAGNPHLAVDASGNAIAVWRQVDGTWRSIWSNRYMAGTGWGTAELIESGTGHAFKPKVSVDEGGNAVAVWYQSDGIRYNIWSNRYLAGTGWGTAELIEMDAGKSLHPQVAVDSSGNAVAVWNQSDGTRYSIWSNRYLAGTGWGTAELIEMDNAGQSRFSQIAVDGSGNAIAVWRQLDRTLEIGNIYSNRYE